MKIFLTLLFFGHFVLAQVAPQKLFSQLTFGAHHFSYEHNFPLNQTNADITQAIIVVHGSALNFETYFNTMQILSTQEKMDNNVLVVSPHYRTDSENPLAPKDELLFTDEGWLSGDAALNNPVTAFDVMDRFIQLFLDSKNFPNLKNVIITGHSAGGQLTQRFAAGTKADFNHPSVHFRYIVANPGSYMYLNLKRLDSTGGFSIPVNPGCAYDDYKYGMSHLNPYMSRLDKTQAVQNYINRDVIYLLGEQDTLTDDFDLSCPALLQGPYRYLRGRNFKSFIDSEFPTHRHQMVTVPGIGHTQWGMYTSPNGVQSLFHNLN